MTVAQTRIKRRLTPWDAGLWRRHALFRPVSGNFAKFAAFEDFPPVDAIDQILSPSAKIAFSRQVVPTRRGRHKYTDPYDAAILGGSVPTRERSWHDFMNALVWATFPKAKLAIHKLQHQYLVQARGQGMVGRRLPAHDALAVLDEGGIVIGSSRGMADESELAVALAAADPKIRAVCFGHAVFEAMAIDGPWPLVRAIVVECDVSASAHDEMVERLDAALANQLTLAAPASPKALWRVSLELLSQI